MCVIISNIDNDRRANPSGVAAAILIRLCFRVNRDCGCCTERKIRTVDIHRMRTGISAYQRVHIKHRHVERQRAGYAQARSTGTGRTHDLELAFGRHSRHVDVVRIKARRSSFEGGQDIGCGNVDGHRNAHRRARVARFGRAVSRRSDGVRTAGRQVDIRSGNDAAADNARFRITSDDGHGNRPREIDIALVGRGTVARVGILVRVLEPLLGLVASAAVVRTA